MEQAAREAIRRVIKEAYIQGIHETQGENYARYCERVPRYLGFRRGA
jgi:hypothetical protein